MGRTARLHLTTRVSRQDTRQMRRMRHARTIAQMRTLRMKAWPALHAAELRLSTRPVRSLHATMLLQRCACASSGTGQLRTAPSALQKECTTQHRCCLAHGTPGSQQFISIALSYALGALIHCRCLVSVTLSCMMRDIGHAVSHQSCASYSVCCNRWHRAIQQLPGYAAFTQKANAALNALPH